VAVSGEYAYVGDGEAHLQVIDVSVPESPRIAGHLDWLGGVATHVAVSGSHLYVTDGFRLQVVDISSPTAPYLVGRWTHPEGSTPGLWSVNRMPIWPEENSPPRSDSRSSTSPIPRLRKWSVASTPRI